MLFLRIPKSCLSLLKPRANTAVRPRNVGLFRLLERNAAENTAAELIKQDARHALGVDLTAAQQETAAPARLLQQLITEEIALLLRDGDAVAVDDGLRRCSASSSISLQPSVSTSRISSLIAPVHASRIPTRSSSNLGHRMPGVSSRSMPLSTRNHWLPRVTPGRSAAWRIFCRECG